MTSAKTGLLLVGHGTRDADGTAEFLALTSLVARILNPVPVQGCLLEFQQPNIPDGWERLVRLGVQHIHVVPLLLFASGHARGDIPEIVFACASASPQVTYDQAKPLSRAPSIVRLLCRRIEAALAESESSLDETCGLVLVGRGSHDPCATTELRILVEIVAHRLGIGHHMAGFYAMAEPRLPKVIDDLVERQGPTTIVVQPHLLFQGKLYDAVAKQVDEAAWRHPHVRFVFGRYLGPCSEVAAAVVHRVAQQKQVVLQIPQQSTQQSEFPG